MSSEISRYKTLAKSSEIDMTSRLASSILTYVFTASSLRFSALRFSAETPFICTLAYGNSKDT